MTSNRTEVGPASAAPERTERIRAAIECEIGPLWHAISALVRSVEKGSGRSQLVQRTEEVLNESVCRALTHPESYQPDRRVLPWLVGIARNVLRGEAREAAGRPRRVEPATGDDLAWEHLFGVLDPPGEAAAARIDVEQILSRLSPPERRAIECRFLKDLEGKELADALGAPSIGAARVRVARALQALRDRYAPDASEVTP